MEKKFTYNNEIELVEIDKLIPYAKNNKDHSEDQINELASIIEAFKKVDPIRLDKNMVIESGHGRVLALKKLGYTHVPCIIDRNSDEYQSMAYRIAHNKIADRAEYLNDNLAFDIGTLTRIDSENDTFLSKLIGMTEFDKESLLNKINIQDDVIFDDKESKEKIKMCPHCGLRI